LCLFLPPCTYVTVKFGRNKLGQHSASKSLPNLKKKKQKKQKKNGRVFRRTRRDINIENSTTAGFGIRLPSNFRDTLITACPFGVAPQVAAVPTTPNFASRGGMMEALPSIRAPEESTPSRRSVESG
jgi:hypothetical protein